MDGAIPNLALATDLAREGLEEAARTGDLSAAQRFLRIWECLTVALTVAPTASEAVAPREGGLGDDPGDDPVEEAAAPGETEPVADADATGAMATEEPPVPAAAESSGPPEAGAGVRDPLPPTAEAAPVAAPVPASDAATEAPPKRPAAPPIRDRLKALCDAIRGFESAGGEDKAVRCAEAKVLLCQAMALWRDAEAANLRYILSKEVETLLAFLRAEDSSDFFDRNDHGQFPAWDWEELGEAYRHVATAEDLTALLRQGEVDAEQRKFGVIHAAAGQAIAARWFIARGLRMDAALVRLRDELQALQGNEYFIPWWRMDGPDAPDPAKVLESANGIVTARNRIETAIQARRKRQEKTRRTNEALGRIGEFLESPGDGDAFEARLAALVEQALEDGIPPSNRPLRLHLAGYRHVAERVGHAQGPQLCEYLEKDAMASLARREVVAEPPTVADESELRRWTEELAPMLRGKTLLLIGGNKGQSHRKNDYRERLGLAEVLWPDLEESDKPTIARPQLDKADIVAYIVRFSRHSYKSLLDEAKRMGKVTVTLPRGLGINTVVRDMYDQLIRARQNGTGATGANGH